VATTGTAHDIQHKMSIERAILFHDYLLRQRSSGLPTNDAPLRCIRRTEAAPVEEVRRWSVRRYVGGSIRLRKKARRCFPNLCVHRGKLGGAPETATTSAKMMSDECRTRSRSRVTCFVLDTHHSSFHFLCGASWRLKRVGAGRSQYCGKVAGPHEPLPMPCWR